MQQKHMYNSYVHYHMYCTYRETIEVNAQFKNISVYYKKTLLCIHHVLYSLFYFILYTKLTATKVSN